MENRNPDLDELKQTFLQYQDLVACPITLRARNFYYEFLPADTIIIDAAELYKREKALRRHMYNRIFKDRDIRPWIDQAKGHFFVPVTVTVLIEYYLRYGEHLSPTRVEKALPCPFYVYAQYPFSFPVDTLDDCLGFFGVKGFDLSTFYDFASPHFLYDNDYAPNISPQVQKALEDIGFEKRDFGS